MAVSYTGRDQNVKIDTRPVFTPKVCGSANSYHQGRKSPLSITIVVLAVYTTVFSGLFLVIGLIAPEYTWIRKGGSLSPYQAGLLAAFFAKTIEISFATVFVAFIGQMVSRRALDVCPRRRQTKSGITLAEIDLRAWVVQPGTMLTHFSSFRSSVISPLGAFSLVAAISALLYTTASDALVQPNLRTISKYVRTQGLVQSAFANPTYLENGCKSPVGGEQEGTSCLLLQYAARGYYDFSNFYTVWSEIALNGEGSGDLSRRPEAASLLYANTTVAGSWVEIVDVGHNYQRYGRIINNITLAMPHAGVPAAAHDERNGIIQPQSQDKQAGYNLQASVPSPAVNVMCVNMNATELAPIVYTAWGNTLNTTLWSTGAGIGWYGPGNYLNKTVVDEIFHWGAKYRVSPPVFATYPTNHSTLLNQTGSYGREALYLLGKGSTDDYALCSIKAFLTPFCFTSYTVSSDTASLRANCSDHDPHHMRYVHSLTNATSGNDTVNRDWPYLLNYWSTSLSLNQGLYGGVSNNAQMLTQLMLQHEVLSPEMPSMAEGIAVMAGSALLMASEASPFVQYWNYSTVMLSPGQYQYFNATLETQMYASGGNGEAGTRAFFIVLVTVFVVNVVCLVYFVRSDGLVTDFTETLNLFSLAISSPASEFMAGSCATGPLSKHFGPEWVIRANGKDLYLVNKEDMDSETESVILDSIDGSMLSRLKGVIRR
ncbi:hypothetical protein E4T49_07930 [Aureobasidium sp. EXF-10728]|nr:hypothetical protein E4T49_07930 [Aureobasidium sp. EXF-10728]